MHNGSQTRSLLLIGFGGLLLLLAFSGLNALSVLRQIETRNQRIREDYIHRDRILNQLRADIYLTGTYVRDFLLERDAARAGVHREEFEAASGQIPGLLSSYQRIVRPEERRAFSAFSRELLAYLSSLRPVLQWSAEQRQSHGYSFMTEQLLPRRLNLIGIADQISGVNEQQMEAESREVASLFASFRRSLLLGLVAMLVCGLVLAAGSIYRILRLEHLSAMRFNEVEQARIALRDLSGRLLEVQEHERRALSRELHDEVGQSLSALLLGIGSLVAMIPPEENRQLRAHLQELRGLAERTVAVVRDMSLLLRPSMLDDLGLIPALQWQAREVSRMKDVAVQVEAGSVPEDLSDDHKTCIYRIVQEALHNATRHANAKSIQVRLGQKDDKLLLVISDDGLGFFPEREKGLGLLGMEERVVHLHGRFHIQSAPGQGTSILVELPLAKEQVGVG